MKKFTIILLFILTSLGGYSQISVPIPYYVVDTNIAGQIFIINWDGNAQFIPRDSIAYDSLGQAHVNHAYFSLTESYVVVTMTKIRILSPGDTIQRMETVRIRYLDMAGWIGSLYNTLPQEGMYFEKIVGILNKKISEE